MSEERQPYNAGDPEQVKGRKEKAKRRDLLKRSALKALMSNAEGRMWMWDLLSSCNVFHSSFSMEALLMAFNEGKRNMGNALIGEINALDGGPELYMRMAIENQSREARD